MGLYENLVNRKIKSPIARGFDLDEWKSQEIENEKDLQLKYGGEIIFSQLEYIRNLLNQINPKLEEYNSDDIVNSYINFLNMHHIELLRKIRETNLKNTTIQNITFKSISENDLTIDELSEGMVELSSLGITSLLCMDSDNNTKIDNAGVDLVVQYNQLSQLYSIYQNLWFDLIHDYKEISIDNEYLENKNLTGLKFKDIDNKYNNSWIEAKYRIDRNNLSEAYLTLAEIDTLEKIGFSLEYPFEKFIYISGDNKIKIKEISQLDKKIKHLIYIDYRKFINCEIWKTLPKLKPIKNEFINLFKVLLQIKILSYSLEEKLLKNNDCDAYHIIKTNCSWSLKELREKISNATGIRSKEIKQYIEFLTFKDKDSDIWSNPLLINKTDSRRFRILLATLMPNVDRILNIWLKQKNIDPSKKGLGFEKFLENKFGENIRNNPILNNNHIDIHSSKIIKIRKKK